MTSPEKMLIDAFAYGHAIFARALAGRRRTFYILAGSGSLGVVISLALYACVLTGRFKQYGLVTGSVLLVIAIGMLLAAHFLPWPKLVSVSWQQAFLVLKPWKTGGTMVGSALPSGDQAVYFTVNDKKILEFAQQLPGVPSTLDDESRKNDMAASLLEEIKSVKCGTIPWSFIQRDGELGLQVAGLVKDHQDLLEDAKFFETRMDPAKAPPVAARLGAEAEIISRHLDVNEANKACLRKCRELIDGSLADSRRHEEMLNQQAASFKSGPPPPDKKPDEIKFNRDEIISLVSGCFTPVLRDLENEASGIIRDLTARKDSDIAGINERLKAATRRNEEEAGKILKDLDQKIASLADGVRAAEEDLRHCEEQKSHLTSEIHGNVQIQQMNSEKLNALKVSGESAERVLKALNARMDKFRHDRALAEERLKSDNARLKETADRESRKVEEQFQKEVEGVRGPVVEIETRRSRLIGLLDAVDPGSRPVQPANSVCDDIDVWVRRIIDRRICIMRGACDRVGALLAELEAAALDMEKKFGGSLWDSAVFDAVRSYFFIPFVTARVGRGRKEQFHLLPAPVVEPREKAGYGGIYWSVEGCDGKELGEYCLQSYDQKLCFPGSGREVRVDGEDGNLFVKFVDQAIIDGMIKDRVAGEMLSMLLPKVPKKRGR